MEDLQTINCEHPVWIFNPKLKEFICHSTEIYFHCGDMDKLITPQNKNFFLKYGYFLHFKIIKQYVLKDTFKGKRYILNTFETTRRKYRIYGKFLVEATSGIENSFPLPEIMKLRLSSITEALSSASISFNDAYYREYLYTFEELSNAYAENRNTGEMIPLFIPTPCNHCILCHDRKSRNLVSRNQMEFATCNHMPLFITLTFNEDNLPKDISTKNQSKIIQNFIKRLRTRLHRAGKATDFRYFIVSEFGSKNHRLHYHILLYNVEKSLCEQVFRTINGKKLYEPIFALYVRKAWVNTSTNDTLGFSYTILTHPKEKGFNTGKADVSKVSNYLVKYMTKGSDKNIHLHSNHFGLEFILKHSKYIKQCLESGCDTWVSAVKGTHTKFPFSRYVVINTAPSLTNSIPKEKRDYFCDTMKLFWQLYNSIDKLAKLYDEKTFEKYHNILCDMHEDICSLSYSLDMYSGRTPCAVSFTNLALFGGAMSELQERIFNIQNDELFKYSLKRLLVLDKINQVYKKQIITNIKLYDINIEKLKSYEKYVAQIESESDNQ